MRDEGLEEGWKVGRDEGWKDGRDEGWKLGRDEGWKLGRDEGWKLGRDEGWKLGRDEGLDEGLKLGRDEGARSVLQGILEARFPSERREALAAIAASLCGRSIEEATRRAMTDSLEALKALPDSPHDLSSGSRGTAGE